MLNKFFNEIKPGNPKHIKKYIGYRKSFKGTVTANACEPVA